MPDSLANTDSVLVDLSDRTLGRYRIHRPVARGGMASVHVATSAGKDGFEKVVALKVIHEHLATDPAFVDMFLDEARIAARIDHANVCSVFDFGASDGTFYMAMEYLVGEPLSTIRDVVKRRPYEPGWSIIAASLIVQACEGLNAAHNLADEDGRPVGVVHRDVSPQNLFVTYGGTVKVVDFGIARASGRSHQTAPGTIKGKFAYLAPEQLTHADSVDRRADVWALGVTLWELLVLRPLFGRSNPAETLTAVMTRTIPAPSAVQPLVPAELDAIVLRALARDPADRYASAREFGRDLSAFCRNRGGIVGAVELEEWLAQLLPGGHESRRSMTVVSRDKTVTRAKHDETFVRSRIDSGKTVQTAHAAQPELSEEVSPIATMLRVAPPPERRPWAAIISALSSLVAVGLATAVVLTSGVLADPRRTRDEIEVRDDANAVAVEAPVTSIAPIVSETRVDPSVTEAPANEPGSTRAPTRGSVRTRTEHDTTPVAPQGVLAPTSSRIVVNSPADTTATPAVASAALLEPIAPPAIPSSILTPRAAPVVAVASAPTPVRVEPAPTIAPAPTFEASLAIRGLDVQGALPSTSVRSGIERIASRMRECYSADARRAGRDAAADVGVRFAIDESGSVRNVRTDGPGGLASCVGHVVARLRSRDRPDIGFVQVAFTARFVPTGRR